jgi:peptidoglycan/xylan/chitin deacetylase (PgdA/CDA1 family)/predicted N-acetyltransferase YhbS
MPARVYLTFDDGPDPEWTPRVTAELARVGARATFFVIGERALEHPEIVRFLHAEGHEVALHCMRHVRHTDTTRGVVERDTRDGLEVLDGLGIRPRRWRPPAGALAPFTRAVARRHRLRLAGWSADPRDWSGEPSGVLLARVAGELHPGAVVVMHDGLGPGATRADCSQTVELIEPLVGQLRQRGWHPAALDERTLRRRAVDRALRPLAAVPRADGGADVAVVAEAELGEAELAELSALLAQSMTRLGAEYAQRPWRRVRPEFRVLARVDGSIVGQVSVFRIGTRPPRRLYGLGDNAVLRPWRGRGIARRLVATAIEEAWRRGAEVVVGDTVALRREGQSLGFAPVPRFRFYYERDGCCRWHPNWMAAIRHPEPRARLELEEADF